MNRLFTAAQAAELLQVKRSWLERQCATRRITAFTKLGGSYRFTADDLAAIVEQHRPTTPGRRVYPRTPPRAAGRPVATSTPAGRSARGRAS